MCNHTTGHFPPGHFPPHNIHDNGFQHMVHNPYRDIMKMYNELLEKSNNLIEINQKINFEYVKAVDDYNILLSYYKKSKEINKPNDYTIGCIDTDFSMALMLLKTGRKLSRTKWDKNIYIDIQKPDANSKMNVKYLYLSSIFYKVPWIPTQEDLFANDWFTVD